jgi:D-alanyl-D-alanine carboxypeptidase
LLIGRITARSLLAVVFGFAVLVVSAGSAAAEALLLVEAETGKVLHAENATYPWHPASLTKLMTAYVTLKAVREGRITLDTLVTVSAKAAEQQPTKMGFRPGTQVTIDNALKMMMVKSANDMAVTLAEGVGGSIENFSEEMNGAAQQLGMTQSNFVNPNGLPDENQFTSARDLAILARALIYEFPEYGLYWRIPAIRLGKRVLRNHNALIDRYPGADGMKTGFICASGFNLVATASRGDKRLIAVVLGAPSSSVRAEQAVRLLEKGFNTSGISWFLSPSTTLASLSPVAAQPVDLHDRTCGPHRRRPATEADDEEPPGSEDASPSSAYAALSHNSLPPGDRVVLGPLIPSMPPVEVFVGAKKPKPQPKPQLAGSSAPKKKKARPEATAAADAPGKPTKHRRAAPTTAARPGDAESRPNQTQ